MDLVTVLVPTYNNVQTMQQTLDSIVAQAHRPIEIITTADACDDANYAFAKAYSQKNTTNDLYFLNLQNTVNAGAGISRNKALQAATDDYIALLDAADLANNHFSLAARKSTTLKTAMNSSYVGTYYLPCVQLKATYDGHYVVRKEGQWLQVVSE